MNAIYFAKNKEFYIEILNNLGLHFDLIVVYGVPIHLREKIRINNIVFLEDNYLDMEDYNLNNFRGIDSYISYLESAPLIRDSYLRASSFFSDNLSIESNVFQFYLYWQEIIQKFSIDLCIRLGSVPHFHYEMSLYYLMMSLNKPFIYSWNVGLGEYVLIRNTLLHNESSYIDFPTNEHIYKDLRAIISDNLNKIIISPEDLTPNYMKMSKFNLNYRHKIEQMISFVCFIVDNPKRGFVSLQNQLNRVINQRGLLYLKNYKKLETNNSSEKYVYVPLHLQPEASTMPLGSYYSRLDIFLAELLRLIPLNYKILIKENPKQTGQARLNKYVSILKNERFLIVNKHKNTYELIKNCSLIASITGTVIYEGVLMGKKCLIFGETHFIHLPNTLHVSKIKDIEQLEEFINKVTTINLDDFNDYITFISKNSLKSKQLIKISENKHSLNENFDGEVNELVSLIIRHL